jgi:hypothetical protein
MRTDLERTINRAKVWAGVVLLLGVGGSGWLGALFAEALVSETCKSVARATVLTLLPLVLLLDLLGLARFVSSYSKFRENVQTAERLPIRTIPKGLPPMDLDKLFQAESKFLDANLALAHLEHRLKAFDEWNKSDETKRWLELRRAEDAILTYVAPYSLLPHLVLTVFAIFVGVSWK